MASDRYLIQLAQAAVQSGNRDDFNAWATAYRETFPDAPAGEAGRLMGDWAVRDLDGKYTPPSGGKSRSGEATGSSPKTFGGWVQKSLATQFKDNAGMAEHEFQDLNSILGIILNDEGGLKNPMSILKDFGSDIGENILLNFKQQNELLMQINEQTGMLGELSAGFREEITEAYPAAIKLGISFDVLTDSVTNLVVQSGKFKLLGQNTIEELALASKFAGDMKEYVQLASEFEKVSLGIYDMTQATNQAGLDALKIGLNSRRVVEGIGDELSMLNQYGFRNGVEGLSRMVQKSIEFRMNMSAVKSLAEEVWEPDSALELVSNLQVLGGAIGDLNDPIRLMYMVTNDVEGLQDALIGATEQLVTYNNEQGRFEVTGANLRRAKAMADELGISMEELTRTAVASMERTQAASDIMSRGLQMEDKDREFLINLSQMKEGRMVIEVPRSLQEALGEQTEIALEDMTQAQVQSLLEQREAFEDMSMEDVALQQVSLLENINRDISYITSMMRIQTGKMVNDLLDATGVDLNKVSVQASDIAKNVGSFIDADLVYDFVKGKFGDEESSKILNKYEPKSVPVDLKKTEVTETTTAPKEQVIRNIYEIRSDSAMSDNMSREMAKKYYQNAGAGLEFSTQPNEKSYTFHPGY